MPIQFRIAFILKDLFEFSCEPRDHGDQEATVKTSARARLPAGQAAQRMPKKETSPDFTRHVCFAIFKAKMDALDERPSVQMPDDHVCHRCASMFASLDHHLRLQDLRHGGVPEPLRVLIHKIHCRRIATLVTFSSISLAASRRPFVFSVPRFQGGHPCGPWSRSASCLLDTKKSGNERRQAALKGMRNNGTFSRRTDNRCST
jgi:hypothetical protein